MSYALTFGLPGLHPRDGVERAFSDGHFKRLRRLSSVSSDRPISLAHCAMVWRFPLNSTKWLFDLLLAWVRREAQTQFLGEYGPFTSMRSMLLFTLGRLPISLRNSSKLFHRGSQTMPRPPYAGNALALRSLHRDRNPTHIWCSGLFDRLWVVFLMVILSLIRHVQCLALARIRLPWITSHSCPHTQRHSQRPFLTDRDTAVRLPKVWPTRSCFMTFDTKHTSFLQGH